jgi:hypothetical protein
MIFSRIGVRVQRLRLLILKREQEFHSGDRIPSNSSSRTLRTNFLKEERMMTLGLGELRITKIPRMKDKGSICHHPPLTLQLHLRMVGS